MPFFCFLVPITGKGQNTMATTCIYSKLPRLLPWEAGWVSGTLNYAYADAQNRCANSKAPSKARGQFMMPTAHK